MFDLQRPSTAVPWGITVCGGRDQVGKHSVFNTEIFHTPFCHQNVARITILSHQSILTAVLSCFLSCVTDLMTSAGSDFQDWKCEANESSIQSWPQQDGLPHIGDHWYHNEDDSNQYLLYFVWSLDKWATSVQHDTRGDGKRNKDFRRHPAVGVWEVTIKNHY